MSTYIHKKLTANLSKVLLVAACSLGFAVSANAAPATNTASITKSSPVFPG